MLGVVRKQQRENRPRPDYNEYRADVSDTEGFSQGPPSGAIAVAIIVVTLGAVGVFTSMHVTVPTNGVKAAPDRDPKESFSFVADGVHAFYEQSVPASTGFLSHLMVVPYGELGQQLNSMGIHQTGSQPKLRTAIVDPAGLAFIQSSPGGAGGASGAIYNWLHITSFPKVVQMSIQKEGDAKFHQYNGCGVIHVASPNLRSLSERTAAMEKLSETYRNVLLEFLTSDATQLRLLPISGSIFAGSFEQYLPNMTFRALDTAFSSLTASLQQQLLMRLNTKAEMCIFEARDLSAYQQAYNAEVARR